MTAQQQNDTVPEGESPDRTDSGSEGGRAQAPASSEHSQASGADAAGSSNESATGSSATDQPSREQPSSDASSDGEGGGDDEGGDDGDEGTESSAGGVDAEGGAAAAGDGTKRKRRRRRRKKGGAEGAPGATAEGAEGAVEGAQQREPREHAPRARNDAHLPFQRFFEGRDRDGRRHAFSVGEVVAGRVLRVEHGAAVVDLFGKAIAFARENEPRDVPIPIPGVTDVEEPEEAPSATANDPALSDPSSVGGAAASFEGSVGMPASESLPPAAMPGDERYVEMGPGPDGILGTADDAPLSSESDPTKIGRAARELSQVGTPSQAGAAEGSEDGAEMGASESGGVEAPEEAPPAEIVPEDPPVEIGAIFRGRVAAVAESGHVAIYNKLVTRADARLVLAKAREEHRRVFGLVYGFNRGGFDVLVEGVRAFCPVSGMTLDHLDDPEVLLGHRLEFSVQQAKSGHQGIVVSRRSILERESRKRAKELRKSLQPGQKIKGRVTQVRDFGVFVDIGGVEGLVHMSEVSWDRSVRPGDAAKAGDEVEVQVLRITEPQNRKDRDGRIALSIKACLPDPWEALLGEISEGTAIKGKVSRATDFGAFVEVAPGIDGLLHITELGKDLRHASEKVKEGEDIYVIVERIDRGQRRISLSKMSAQDAKLFDEGQLEVNKGSGGKAVRPGSMIKVKVDRVEVTGLHVQVEGVIGRRGRGFIPNVEMGTDRGSDHRKKFPPGTELDVKVIGTDRDGGLRLSRKAFHQDEERKAVHDYRKEAATKGFGTFGDLLKKKIGAKKA